jgi:Arc/MetJ-type ribon-helix-helix transcriptional regulator
LSVRDYEELAGEAGASEAAVHQRVSRALLWLRTPPARCSDGRKLGRMMGMKVSISLPGRDVAFLDEYASIHEYSSRSAVVHQAVQALRLGELREAYGDSWAEWHESGEGASWDLVAGDGM